jgi:hypothetical protein
LTITNVTSVPDAPTPTDSNVRLKRFLIIASIGVIVLILALVTISLIVNSVGGSRHDSVAVLPGMTSRTFVNIPGDRAFPTGMVRNPDGEFYVAAFGTGIIYKVDADGSLSTWVDSTSGIRAPASLAIAPDGSVYVLDFSSANPSNAVGSIKRIAPDRTVSTVNGTENDPGLSFLSHLVFDDRGGYYVTKTVTGEVWYYPATGQATLWLKLPGVGDKKSQPTGIAYNVADHWLAIGDAGVGIIYRVPIKSDGTSDVAVPLYSQAGLTVQGLAFDTTNTLLFANWLHDDGEVLALRADGKPMLVAEHFRAPTDLVPNGASLYVVNSDLPGLVPILRAKPPFTVDVVEPSAGAATVAPTAVP